MASDSYRRDPRLKQEFVNIEFTKEQMIEYHKCSKDLIYFLENYYYIISEINGKQLIDFKERPYQREMALAFLENQMVIAKLGRRLGKTIIVVGFILWYSLFHEEKTIHILSNKGGSANSILRRFKKSYREIPKWMQQGVATWGVTSIELESGTEISAHSTSSDAIRGEPGHIIYMDEFAFVPGRIAHEFYTAVYPIISGNPTSKMIITSTPNGYNYFWKIWEDAVNKINGFKYIVYDWTALKRPKGWKKKEIANIGGDDKFRQEHGCEFIGGTNSLISGQAISELAHREPLLLLEDDNLKIFDLPKDNHRYVITCDVAEGIGQDYSAFSVIDMTEKPFKQVARYRCNTVSIIQYPNIIYSAAMRYNEAYILVELNDIGDQVASTLRDDMEYENMLFTRLAGPKGQQITFMEGNGSRPGVKTSKTVKRLGCANLKYLIENKQLLTPDIDTHIELSNFVKKGNSFAATDGETDDIVMTLVLLGWLIKQGKFEELIKYKVQKFKEKEEIPQIMDIDYILKGEGKDENDSFEDGKGNVWSSVSDAWKYLIR